MNLVITYSYEIVYDISDDVSHKKKLHRLLLSVGDGATKKQFPVSPDSFSQKYIYAARQICSWVGEEV